MKILFVLENYYPNIGGVETLFKKLTEHLVLKDFEITVVTNRFSKELQKKEVINQVTIIRLPFYNRYLFTFFAFFPLIKYAKQHELIHTTSYNAAIPAYLSGLLTRTPVIITFHEVWSKLWFDLPYMNKISLTLHYTFEWFLLKLKFLKWIAVSEYTKQSLLRSGIPDNKIKRIYNGINYQEFESIDKKELLTDNKFQFTYFGRLGISKGLDILLPGIKKLSKKRTDFILNLIIPKSPKSFYDKITNDINSLSISQYVKVKSHLPWETLKSVINQSDAVIVPSYSEGFCYSAVEAMALETPIISSGKGALAEVVSGKHLIMDEHNSDALSECMQKALNDEWIETPKRRYPLEQSVAKYIELYNELKL